MKRLYAALALLLFLPPVELFAADNATETAAQQKINASYTAIHEHVCTDLGELPCLPSLDADEKWAFVKTWCARRPAGADATACQGLPTSGGPVVIAFDHDGRGWRAIDGVDPRDIDTDVNGAPKVLTSNGRKVISVVESTNPLVYKAEAGAITESDAPVVENIKALFAKLGPALLANVSQAEEEDPTDPSHETDQAAIRAVITAAAKIECIPDQWIRARDFTQHVENRKDAAYTVLSKQQNCPTGTATLDAAFESLRNASEILEKIKFCADEVAELTAWLDMSPTNVKALREKQEEIILGVTCEERLGVLKQEIDNRLDDLERADTAAANNSSPPNLAARADQRRTWREQSVNNRRVLARFTATTQKAAEAVAAAGGLLTTEKKAEIADVLDKVKQFDRRLVESAATVASLTDGEFQTKEVADFFVVRHGAVVVSWTKNRTRTLTVTKASPFDDITTNRPDSVATSYGAASLAASLVDMTVALTHTDLSSPEFGAVSEAAPTAEDPNATRNVIAETDEDSRSGELAVMVALPVFYRLSNAPWARRLGLELGAGASTSNPALFLGFTARLNGGVRLGVGITQQQVKDLNGQSPGDPISAETDIKLRDVHERSWYASFSLSLESIGNLFSAE